MRSDCNYGAIFAVPLVHMRTLLTFLVLAVALSSCSEYNKILKDGTQSEKLEAALRYYNEGECYKALPLLEELIGLYRGKEEAEQIYFTYAQVHYCIGDFYLANYYFKNFTKSYPTSAYAEESLFLAAMCSYKLSPPHSLDQDLTRLAISEFQVFVDRFPDAVLKDSCNTMVETLNAKLDTKQYEVAALYVKTEKYKSARVALQEVLDRSPGTPYREDVMLLLIEANTLYAERSIEDKKAARYGEAVESYFNFVTYFPDSPRLKEAEAWYNRAQSALDVMK